MNNFEKTTIYSLKATEKRVLNELARMKNRRKIVEKYLSEVRKEIRKRDLEKKRKEIHTEFLTRTCAYINCDNNMNTTHPTKIFCSVKCRSEQRKHVYK